MSMKDIICDISFNDLVFYADGLYYEDIKYNRPENQTAWTNKPAGGLWASPIAHPTDWISWCDHERDVSNWKHVRAVDGGTFFTLKENARVVKIFGPRAYAEAAKRYPLHQEVKLPLDPTMLDVFDLIARGEDPLKFIALDFEAMVDDGVDAVYCEPLLMRAFGALAPVHAWDCTSLVVLNRDAIRNVKRSAVATEDRIDRALALYPHLRARIARTIRFFSRRDWASSWFVQLTQEAGYINNNNTKEG